MKKKRQEALATYPAGGLKQGAQEFVVHNHEYSLTVSRPRVVCLPRNRNRVDIGVIPPHVEPTYPHQEEFGDAVSSTIFATLAD